MNGLMKMMKKMTTTHVVSLLAFLALGYALYQYSGQKSMVMDAMSGAPVAASSHDRIKSFPDPAQGKPCIDNVPVQGSGPVGATEDLGETPEFASAKGIGTSTHGLPAASSCQRSQVTHPKELMPKGETEWSKFNLSNINLLSVPSHIGIETKGSSLRNANLQFRPDPVIPRSNTGPFLQSTITHDNRRGFELTC